MDEYSDVDFGGRWTHALAFRWGPDLSACLGAYMAAAAYAAASGGVVFDCEENKLKSPHEAGETARKIEAELPLIERRMKELFSR